MEMIGESCPFKGVMSFVIGGALGAGMGVVLTAMGGMGGPVHQPGYADPYANAPIGKLVSPAGAELALFDARLAPVPSRNVLVHSRCIDVLAK